MSDDHDAVLDRVFAPPRALEPTDEEVSQVLERLASNRMRHLGSRRWHARAGNVLTAFAIAVALAVAGLSIVLAHSRHNSAGPAQTGPAQTGPAQPGPAATPVVHGHGTSVLGATALRTEIHALRGHPIVIMAWGTWCQPCIDQLPKFASVAARYPHQVVFLGVDIGDTRGEGKSYLAQHPVRYRNYRATLKRLQSILGVPIAGLPTTFFLNPAGKVEFVHTGEYGSRRALRLDVERQRHK